MTGEDDPIPPALTSEQEADLIAAVDVLVDVALTSHASPEGETFTHCGLCGEWEGHRDGCPIPWLERWQLDSIR